MSYLPIDCPYTTWEEVETILAKQHHALKDILDAAERAMAGFPIESEEWYARRDFARIALDNWHLQDI